MRRTNRRGRAGRKRSYRNAGMAKRWAKVGRRGFQKRWGKLKGAARISKRRKVLGIKRRKPSYRKAVRSLMPGAVKALMGNPGRRRYSRNSGVLGKLRLPSVGGLPGKILKPFSKGNVKAIAGIGLGAAGVVALLRYAPIPAGYNSGYWGVGATVLAAGAAATVGAMVLPAWAGAIGLGAAAAALLRGAITVAPRVLGYVVTPLLEWQPTAPAAAPAGVTAGFRALPRGTVAGFLNSSPSAYGAMGENFSTSKNVF